MKLKKSFVPSKNNFYLTIANSFANLLLKRGKKNNAYRLLLDSLLETDVLISNRSLNTIPNSEKLDKQKTSYLKRVSNTIRTSLQPEKEKQFPKKRNFSVKKMRKSNKEKCLQILEYVKPNLETRKVRRGGTIYQVPSILSEKRQKALAIRWLINAADTKNKNNKKITRFSEGLGEEFSSTLKKASVSRQKREQLHSVAALNRGNIRYRWW